MLKCVGRLGFEPGMTEPKPVVLPLHHRPKKCDSFEIGCKGRENLAYRQIFPYHFSILTSHFSFYNEQIVVLLTLLGQQILAIDEVLGSDGTVLIGQLLLIQADTATLHHFTHLTL